MATEYPEWRTEQDLLADERCWPPIGGAHAHALPLPRLERTVQELRRTSHGLQHARPHILVASYRRNMIYLRYGKTKSNQSSTQR
jgi:hypothetical protein